MATNCCGWPKGTEGLVGSTAMEASSAAVTVNSVWPERPVSESVAVMRTVPMAWVLAWPFQGETLLMEATDSSEVVQLRPTWSVRSWVVLSVK